MDRMQPRQPRSKQSSHRGQGRPGGRGRGPGASDGPKPQVYTILQTNQPSPEELHSSHRRGHPHNFQHEQSYMRSPEGNPKEPHIKKKPSPDIPAAQPIILGSKNFVDDRLKLSDGKSEQKQFAASAYKLITEQWNFQHETLSKSMLDNTNFVVVGVLGGQGVGKSTVMSLLHGKHKSHQPAFNIQSKEHQILSQHCSTGVDATITAERIILLDTQALFSPSTMVDLIKNNTQILPECVSYEHMHEIQCLQLAIFIMSVCHVIIVVQDGNCIDWKLWNFIQRASMLKTRIPDLSTMSAGAQVANNIMQQQRFRNQLDKIKSTLNLSDLYNPATEYYPNLVFLFNRCPIEMFTVRAQLQLRHTLHKFFQNSPFVLDTPLINPVLLEDYLLRLKKAKEEAIQKRAQYKETDATQLNESKVNQPDGTPKSLDVSAENDQEGEPRATSDEQTNTKLPEPEQHVSFFTLPLDNSDNSYNSVSLDIDLTATYQSSSETFRNNMLATLCNNQQSKRFSSDNLTEKEWLKNAAQVWFVIRKSPVISDFNKLLQTTAYRTTD